jgi:hypothetical protein
VSSHVRKGFKTRLESKQIEIDVLTRFGDYLFLFECKHSLLPCNPHEMRTSYEHMKKAASQLTIIRDLLDDGDVELELYRRLGWDLPPASEIITCIVSCNGMFPGLTMRGHPIYRWSELKNVIESGLVRVGRVRVEENEGEIHLDSDHVVERSLWDGDELTPSFLRRYIKEGLLRDILYGAMVKREPAYQLEECKLVFSTFSLNAVTAQRNFEQVFGAGSSAGT